MKKMELYEKYGKKNSAGYSPTTDNVIEYPTGGVVDTVIKSKQIRNYRYILVWYLLAFIYDLCGCGGQRQMYAKEMV